MDIRQRELQRSGDSGDPEAHIRWLLQKIRTDQLSESMKRLLCSLGYVPMTLALNLPTRQSPKQISFMKPKTFCAYKGGRWLLGMDYRRIAQYLCKKHWSQQMSVQVLKDCNPKLTDIPVRQTYEELVDKIAEADEPIGVRESGSYYELIDGYFRLRTSRQAPVKFFMVLTGQLRKVEVRDGMIKAILARLA